MAILQSLRNYRSDVLRYATGLAGKERRFCSDRPGLRVLADAVFKTVLLVFSKNYYFTKCFGRFCCLTVVVHSTIGIGAAAPVDSGPLYAKNRFPLHMIVLTPRPVTADLPRQGSLEATLALEYSNTFFDFRNDRWDMLIDMEAMVVELSMMYGLTGKLAIGVDLPLVFGQSGVLDGFLQNYHNFLGVSNYNREVRPKNKFAYRVTKDGHLWIDGQSETLRIGETAISAKYALMPMNLGGYTLKSSVLATIKIPTGDADSGFGSGAYDVGFFVPMNWNVVDWTFYIMLGGIRINTPETKGAQVSTRNVATFFIGAAYQYNDKWRWMAQANYYTSPFEKTGIDELDMGAFELSFGVQRKLSKSLSWEFAFSEDLTRAVPDFNLRLGLTYRLGKKMKKK